MRTRHKKVDISACTSLESHTLFKVIVARRQITNDITTKLPTSEQQSKVATERNETGVAIRRPRMGFCTRPLIRSRPSVYHQHHRGSQGSAAVYTKGHRSR
ncbi:hypothetical protein QWZ16_20490 [Vibrio ostreicida]|uniref:Uncharacterized protein n=1 Tax=Vibrio ostreicida TaxID=526588 RepID=A0ABT8BY69_9VIBR|nr:hypothetical protein [Vibrio ostreicida]MDN3611973.1 hypothetical protein [Vibrio ostreicida]